MRVFHAICGVLFALSAALQWNDPDPLAWTAFYTAAAVLAFMAFRGRARAPALLALAGLCAVWMALLSGSMAAFIARGDFGLLFATMKASEPLIEDSREFLGLALVLAWTLTTVVSGRRSAPVA